MRRPDPIPVALAAVFMAVAALYATRVPYGTPPDEAPHVAYVRYLSENHRLPTLGESDLESTYEYHQPPLYYSLLLGVWSASQGSGPIDVAPDATKRPPESIVALRLFGVFLTAILIVVIYTGMRRVGLGRPTASLVAGLFGFVPMNVYMSASVNNDVLASFINVCALVAFGVGIVREIRPSAAVGLGVLVGLGIWTKTSCLLLVPAFYAAVYLATGVPRTNQQGTSSPWRLVLWFTLAALVVGGPWLVRNGLVYGDPLAAGAYNEAFSQTNVTPSFFLDELGMPLTVYLKMWARYTFTSFWGLFGHTDVAMQPWIYYTLLGLCIASLIGLGRSAYGRRSAADRAKVHAAWLYLACLLISFAVYVRFNLDYFQAQARYLGIGLFPICFLLAVGWLGLSGQRFRAAAALVLLGCLIVLDLYALFGVILPNYGV